MTLSEAKKLYLKAKAHYYNGDSNPIITDAQFDKLEASIRLHDPKWPELKKTGVRTLGKKQEAKLLVPMPSLDKIVFGQDPKRIQRWVASNAQDGHVLVMPKLDGASLQLVYEKGKPQRLFTRGDGVLGKECSYFLPHLNIPQQIDCYERLVIRAEAVLPMSVFQKKWSSDFKAARNAVSGLFNREDLHKAIKDVHIVSLRLLSAQTDLKAGLNKLDSLGFQVIKTAKAGWTENFESRLGAYLEKIRSSVDYEMDGLVLHHPGEGLRPTQDRPEYAKAWKLNDEEDAVLATVKRIHWTPSRHGILVPKAELDPVKVSGATIRYATLNNASWMQERGVGAGAQVKLIRSGQIIPKIIDVTKRAKFSPPSKALFGDFSWDENKTHLVLENSADSAEVQTAVLNNFFSKLGSDGLGKGISAKLVAAGVTTPFQALTAPKKVFLTLEGFADRSAEKAYSEIQSLREKEFPLAVLMVSSGVFDKSIGTTRIEAVLESDPDLVKSYTTLGITAAEQKQRIESIHGLGASFAETFVSGLPRFYKWLSGTGLKVAATKKKSVKKGKWTGKFGTWTGYRSPEQEAEFEEHGGVVVSFGSKTNILFYKAGGKSSSKIDKAKEKGLKTSTWEKFNVV